MISLEIYDREYHPDTYNCAHFVCDVWDEVTGTKLGDRLKSFLLPGNVRTAAMSVRHGFTRLPGPKENSLAMMNMSLLNPHIGIYCKNRILHLGPQGVMHMDAHTLRIMGIGKIHYYDVKADNTDH